MPSYSRHHVGYDSPRGTLFLSPVSLGRLNDRQRHWLIVGEKKPRIDREGHARKAKLSWVPRTPNL